jgi:hypothetical protein
MRTGACVCVGLLRAGSTVSKILVLPGNPRADR